MSNVQVRLRDETVVLEIEGDFGMELLSVFREKFKEYKGSAFQFVIDLKKCTSINSTALGAILMLRRHCEESVRKITIKNCNDDVSEILEIMSYKEIFNLVNCDCANQHRI